MVRLAVKRRRIVAGLAATFEVVNGGGAKTAAFLVCATLETCQDGILYRGQDALCFRLVRHFDVFAFVLNSAWLQRTGGSSRAEKGMNGPILFWNECRSFLFALNDQFAARRFARGRRKVSRRTLFPQERETL